MRSLDKKSDAIFFTLGIVFIFIFWLVLSLIVNNQYAIPKVDKTTKALGDLFSNSKTYLILGKTLLRIEGIDFIDTCGRIIVYKNFKGDRRL